MIKKPENWESVSAFAEKRKLPAGAYECHILQAAVKNENYGNTLCVLIDIDAGEYAGYFADEFARNQREDKKWRGVLRLPLPVEDGSDKDRWRKSLLKGFIAAVEASNRGYTWAWDERTLKDRSVGVIFRSEEWEWNGKTGWTAKPFRAIPVDDVADGNFTIPSDRPLNREPAPAPFSAQPPAPEFEDASFPF